MWNYRRDIKGWYFEVVLVVIVGKKTQDYPNLFLV